MGCDECREAISAQLDGEEPPGDERSVAAHLEGCPQCRLFADRAAHVTRLARTGLAEPGPDLVRAVLAAAPPPPRHRTDPVLRVALDAVGVGQLALALTAVVGAAGAPHGSELAGASTVHLANESTAWNVALGIAFLWAAAVRADRLSGLVPVLGAFVGVLACLSVLDLVGGRVEVQRLVGHLLAVAGLVLILWRRRIRPDRGGRGAGWPADGTAPTGGGRRHRWVGRAHREDGLRPTAHRRAA